MYFMSKVSKKEGNTMRKIPNLGSKKPFWVGNVLNMADRHIFHHPFTYPMHRHRHIEISIFLSSGHEYITEQTVYQVQKGDVFVITPPNAHAIGGNAAFYDERLLTCTPKIQDILPPGLFLAEGFNDLFSSGEVHTFRLTQEELHDAVLLHELLSKEFQNIQQEFYFAFGSHFTLLIILLTQAYLRKKNIFHISPDRISQSLKYIQDNFRESLSLEMLAELAKLSKSQFLRLFHRKFGKSPIQYQLELRMEYARDLLKQTDLPINAIAEETGFSDSNYFSARFHRSFGISPKNFRVSEKERSQRRSREISEN